MFTVYLTDHTGAFRIPHVQNIRVFKLDQLGLYGATPTPNHAAASFSGQPEPREGACGRPTCTADPNGDTAFKRVSEEKARRKTAHTNL